MPLTRICNRSLLITSFHFFFFFFYSFYSMCVQSITPITFRKPAMVWNPSLLLSFTLPCNENVMYCSMGFMSAYKTCHFQPIVLCLGMLYCISFGLSKSFWQKSMKIALAKWIDWWATHHHSLNEEVPVLLSNTFLAQSCQILQQGKASHCLHHPNQSVKCAFNLILLYISSASPVCTLLWGPYWVITVNYAEVIDSICDRSIS